MVYMRAARSPHTGERASERERAGKGEKECVDELLFDGFNPLNYAHNNVCAIDSSACELWHIGSHSSRILCALRKLGRYKGVAAAFTVEKKTYNKILFIRLMAQFAIWILIFFSASCFLSHASCVCSRASLFAIHLSHLLSLKLMCWVEEECLPHLFDVCVVLRFGCVFFCLLASIDAFSKFRRVAATAAATPKLHMWNLKF